MKSKIEREAEISATFNSLNSLNGQELIFVVESNRENTDFNILYFFPMFSLLATATQISNIFERTKNKNDKALLETLYKEISITLLLFTYVYNDTCEYYKDSGGDINIERVLAINAIVRLETTLSNLNTAFSHNLQCNLQQLRKFINYETGTAS